MPVPEKTEVPVSRDANELRPTKHRRACCRGSMRCECPKRPKGRLAGTQRSCGPANTARPVFGKHAMPVPEKTEVPVSRDANELRSRKHRRACCRGSMRCACPKRQKCHYAGTQRSCGPANTAGLVVGEACDVRKTWLYSPNNFAQ